MATYSYRYWRLNFTANGNLSPMMVQEIELRGAVGGVDLTYPGIAITASSQQVVLPASNAVDGTSSAWQAGSGAVPQWLAVDFGSPVAIREVAITPPGSWDYTPTAFDVQYSSDGTNWTTLASFSGLTLPWASSPRLFALSNDLAIDDLGGNGADFRPLIPYFYDEDMPNAPLVGLGNSQSGIGAFVQAAVIRVTGRAPAIDVDIDRPLIYDGTYVQTPPGSGYTIGQPTLDDLTARVLTIPVAAVAPATPTVVSVTPAANLLQVLFSVDVSLLATAPELWTITPTTGVAVTVTGVSIVGRTVLLATTNQTPGASYTLNVPAGAVGAGTTVNAASAQVFTGVGLPLTIVSSHYVNSTDVIVTFSRAVQEATALLPGNYVFVPSVAVERVERITDVQYAIRTAPMQPGVLYSVAVSGVLALDGTPI